MKILVTGPESSGTRLMARILKATGSEVKHAPMPYKASPPFWPTDRNFDNFQPEMIVVMVRDETIVIRSQLRAGLVSSARHALRNIEEAYLRLTQWLSGQEAGCVYLSYERLIDDPKVILSSLCARLEIPYPQYVEELYDGNAKYTEVP